MASLVTKLFSPRVSLGLCLEPEAESQSLAPASLKNRAEEGLFSTHRIPPLDIPEARGPVCPRCCTLSLTWAVWAAFNQQ